jgi:zinc transport system ATP-binding protein
MTTALIEVHDLRVRLGDTDILKGLYTQIPRGQLTALIGLNGSGKTTFLRAILKEVPYTGQVRFRCGHNHDLPFPQHIGYVPQRLLFDTNLPMTVAEMLALALEPRPLWLGLRRGARPRLAKILERAWAGHLLDQPVGGLSGGELQRVLLALALEPAPEILLLDEPASGIDFKHADDFYALIHQLNRETGVTVLLVSHELSVVTRFADRVLCMKEGRIQGEGSPREILQGETIAQIFGPDKGLVVPHRHG